MNERKFHRAIAALALSFTHFPAAAMLPPRVQPLPEAIDHAPVIVLARLLSYTPDPLKEFHPKPSIGANGQQAYTGEDAFFLIETLRKPGRCSFQVLQTIRGEAISPLDVDLSYVFSYAYGGTRFKWGEGDLAILTLERGSQGRWAPEDENRPLIPVSNILLNAETAGAGKPAEGQVIDLIVASLADPVWRRVDTFLLRDVTGPDVVVGLTPYLNDADPHVSDNVLYAMAVNQQVSAIPRIGALVEKPWQKSRTPEAVHALARYRTPEAVPYLNPLLFSLNTEAQMRALDVVVHFDLPSSAPYLLLTMRNPNPAGEEGFSAFGALERQTRSVSSIMPEDYYRNQRDAMKPIVAWWRDELSGKHGTHGDEPQPGADALKGDEPVTRLNPLLFEVSPATRRAAMAALAERADHSSIPYLLVALDDPDLAIAYGAYGAVHRVIDGLGPGVGRAAFEANREESSKPLYDWWFDEIQGKHDAGPVGVRAPGAGGGSGTR